MSLEDFIIVVYVWVDDQLKAWLGPGNSQGSCRLPRCHTA